MNNSLDSVAKNLRCNIYNATCKHCIKCKDCNKCEMREDAGKKLTDFVRNHKNANAAA